MTITREGGAEILLIEGSYFIGTFSALRVAILVFPFHLREDVISPQKLLPDEKLCGAEYEWAMNCAVYQDAAPDVRIICPRYVLRQPET